MQPPGNIGAESELATVVGRHRPFGSGHVLRPGAEFTDAQRQHAIRIEPGDDLALRHDRLREDAGDSAVLVFFPVSMLNIETGIANGKEL